MAGSHTRSLRAPVFVCAAPAATSRFPGGRTGVAASASSASASPSMAGPAIGAGGNRRRPTEVGGDRRTSAAHVRVPRWLAPASPCLQPKDLCRDISLLGRHVEQALSDADVRLGGSGIQLVPIPQPERLGRETEQAGDLVLGDAKAREGHHLAALLIGRLMLRTCHANAINNLEVAAAYL